MLQHRGHLRAELPFEGQDLFALLADIAHKGLGGEVHLRRGFLLDLLKTHLEKRRFVHVFHDPSLGHALDQGLDLAVGQLHHAKDLAHGAHGEDLFGLRFFVRRILLGRKENEAIPFQGMLHGAHRPVPADEQGQEHVIEDHHIPNRHQGKNFRDFVIGNLFFDEVDQIVFVGNSHSNSCI